jgi:hypothetical protein
MSKVTNSTTSKEDQHETKVLILLGTPYDTTEVVNPLKDVARQLTDQYLDTFPHLKRWIDIKSMT